MIHLTVDSGHYEIEMSGTGREITGDTYTIIRAVYDAMMKATPEIAHDMYGNLYRLLLMKAFSDCNNIDFESSYPKDV